MRGEQARGGGWLCRAQRLPEEAPRDCAEQGYVRIPAALRALEGGDPAAARPAFNQIMATADRFGDTDLRALGKLGRGQVLVAVGDAGAAPRMLDEAMMAVPPGRCRRCRRDRLLRSDHHLPGIFDLRRAREWTAALSRWCDTQQDLKPYRGQCLVHRSELMQLHGAWADAMAEGRGRASTWPTLPVTQCRHGAVPAGRTAAAARRVHPGRAGLPRARR